MRSKWKWIGHTVRNKHVILWYWIRRATILEGAANAEYTTIPLGRAASFELVSEPDLAEAKAACWELLTSHEAGHSRVVLTFDCLNLVRKVNCAGAGSLFNWCTGP